MEAAYFRHASGELVSTLCRRFGLQHLEAVEDAVQAALLAAVETWPRQGEPDDQMAWLYRVSHRALLDELRTGHRRRRILSEQWPESVPDTLDPRLAGELRDDLLRMLFVCCDPELPVASQLAIALKTLCGFGVREIALRLFVAETAVYKRLSRARTQLRARASKGFDAIADLDARRPQVLRVIHQLFTEGHLSLRAPALRRDLCDEAIRLAHLLADHPAGAHPDTFALLALMHLHSARLDARMSASGELLLLEEQDRRRWDASQMQIGLAFLARSAEGDSFSRYHAEAGIAAEHGLAPSFEETRWDRIIACYDQLERVAPSPLHRLHRAVAVAAVEGPEAGLAALEGDVPPTWLEGSYLWAAVLADLHRRCGHPRRARERHEAALRLAPSPAVRDLLARRFERADPDEDEALVR